MPQFQALQIPPPKNWQDFEELCADLWGAKYNSDNTQMHGRTGQSQYGVDCFGQIGSTRDWFGVQCKGKDGRYGNSVTIEELNAEVDKAKEFSPKLKVFVLATTAQNDGRIQAHARQLTEKHQKEGLFSVEVKSWDEIHRELSRYPTVISKHYPSFNIDAYTNSHNFKLTHSMQPPRPSTYFVGRRNELEELISSLDRDSTIQVCGLGGIGKSELVSQALKQRKTARNVIWCNIEKYSSVDDLLLSLLKVFSGLEDHCDIEGLSTYFDKYKVSIVFDGIEQNSLNELEKLEDLIKQWHLETSAAQFIMTTQAELYGVPYDKTIILGGLLAGESRLLFEQRYGSKQLVSDKGLDKLLAFCDGHVLAITFAAVLTKYYGCAEKVMRITFSSEQPQSLGLPERLNHNRHTSLELCLKAAYDALSLDSKQLLWALSESPGGINTCCFDEKWLEITNVDTAYASLKRWNFVTDIEVIEGVFRTNVLAPVRKFVSKTAISENLEDYEEIVSLLAERCLVLVAEIEYHYSTPDKYPILMDRYETELPNILNIIELAHSRENNKDLNKIAGKLASAIMQFYFVNGAPQLGIGYLKSSAELALKVGDVKNANDLLQQLLSLSSRGRNGESELDADALELLKRVELAAKGEDLSPEISMTKALWEGHKSPTTYRTKDLRVEEYARDAIEGFKYRLNNKINARSYDDEYIRCSLSTLFAVLGTSLLNQGKEDAALDAYLGSLKYQTESTSGVNLGQTHHQIGKCESKLGRHKSAVVHFSKSLKMFIHVGMSDYISHSSGELGHSLVKLSIPSLDSELPEWLIFEVLLDLKIYTLKTFDLNNSLDFEACSYNIRKLVGTFYLLSFLDQAYKIEPFVEELKKEIYDKLISYEESILLSANQVYPLDILHMTLELGCYISSLEKAIGTDAESEAISYFTSNLLDCEFYYFIDSEVSLERAWLTIEDWLSVYLKRKNIEFNY